jgi:hypothetical protein
MKPHLNTYQRRFAQHRMTFDNLLSPELAESLLRASLACFENQRKETGIIEFFCGLYLQNQKEISTHFHGDFAAVVRQNFPKHRFGHEGLVPKVMLDQMTSEGASCDPGVMFSFQYSDELHRLLWLSARLANAVGKKASVKDAIAAVTLDRGWMDELLLSGITPSRNIADFDREVRTVIFHATPHTSEGWPRQMDFEHVGTFQSPFTLEASTPSGRFQPVRSAKVKLNGGEVASIAWPDKPTVRVGVELLNLNKIEFELDGPAFGSVEVTVRGTPA